MQSKPHTQPHRSARADRALRERELAALAHRQHGVVGRNQLLALGLGDGAIKARFQLGQLHNIHRGVYSVGHGGLTVHSRWLAAVLASGDGAVLSHRSAAALWGLMRPRWSPVDVTSAHGRPGRNGIVLHRSALHAEERTVEARIPVTSVARTLLDLAGVLDGDGGLRRAFEEADRLKLLHMPELERVCARAGKRKGLPALRRLAAAAREPVTTRSHLEDRFAEFCRKHLADLSTPQTNAWILDHEVDAYWPSHGLVVELDGFAYHGHRAAFENDRARDAAMQAAGYRVIRLTYRQLETEALRIATQLRKLLGADRRQPVR